MENFVLPAIQTMNVKIAEATSIVLLFFRSVQSARYIWKDSRGQRPPSEFFLNSLSLSRPAMDLP